MWLPERSINPPELSQRPWGFQPGEQAVVSSCKLQTQPEEPGRTRETGALSVLGALGSSGPALGGGQWCPVPGRCGQALAKGFSGTHHSIGRSPPALEAGLLPSSFRKVRFRKSSRSSRVLSTAHARGCRAPAAVWGEQPCPPRAADLCEPGNTTRGRHGDSTPQIIQRAARVPNHGPCA